MKYKLFRSPGDLDKAVRKHELVAVETGKSIDDVADALIRAVQVHRPALLVVLHAVLVEGLEDVVRLLGRLDFNSLGCVSVLVTYGDLRKRQCIHNAKN